MVDAATRLMVVDCRGTARQIGEAHGEATRDLIADVRERWSDWLGTITGEALSSYLERFLGETRFLPAIERHTPELLEELEGIAAGANQPFETMLAYALMDEEWSFRKRHFPGMTEPPPGCTSVALGTAAIAQTMDIPSVHDGTQVALRVVPQEGPRQILFTAAGMLALNGANAAGVGVVVNSLAQLPASLDGLPVAFVIRGILSRRSAAEAAEFVERAPHAIGQHYLIGDGQELFSLEAAANGVRRVEVGERYVHANHPLVNLARRPDAEALEAATNTHARHARAETLMATASEQCDLEAALADREAPISLAAASRLSQGDSMTFGGTSIGFDASPPRVRISPGPPHSTPWQEVAWPA